MAASDIDTAWGTLRTAALSWMASGGSPVLLTRWLIVNAAAMNDDCGRCAINDSGKFIMMKELSRKTFADTANSGGG